jgi:hypothetical protein
MPHPDPRALELVAQADGSMTVRAEIWPHGNRRHRIARLRAVARNLCFDGWRCLRCRTEIAIFKRADARYCSEQCRKCAARERRRRRPAAPSPET